MDGGGRVRIAIDTIPEDGVDVAIQPDTDWAVSVAATVLEVDPTELVGSLRVLARGRLVQVRGQVRATGGRTCERCGTDTDLTLGGEVALDYVPVEEAPRGHAEVRLAPGDLDVGWYAGGILDLADVVSEALALTLPPRVQCADTDACDARVQAMLSAANADSVAASSPFAALDKLT